VYYIEYKIDGTKGQGYIVDTGFGILELGEIENGYIYEEKRLTTHPNLESYLEDYTAQIISITKVL